MRTTLDIDDDVLTAAKEIARRQNTTTGKVVSSLLKRSLAGSPAASPVGAKPPRRNAAGFRPLPPRGGVVSNDLVNRLRDQEGI